MFVHFNLLCVSISSVGLYSVPLRKVDKTLCWLQWLTVIFFDGSTKRLYKSLVLIEIRAGLQDNVLADLLPLCQDGRTKSASLIAIQPRCTDVPDWVTNFCRATHLRVVTVLILSATVASWHPTGATLAEGQSETLSCNPAQTCVSQSQIVSDGSGINGFLSCNTLQRIFFHCTGTRTCLTYCLLTH